MNEYIKKQIFKILSDEQIEKAKIDRVLVKINNLFTPQDSDEDLPRAVTVVTPLFTGRVYLSEQGGKYFYKDDRGAVILAPASKKIMRQKINKYIGRES